MSTLSESTSPLTTDNQDQAFMQQVNAIPGEHIAIQEKSGRIAKVLGRFRGSHERVDAGVYEALPYEDIEQRAVVDRTTREKISVARNALEYLQELFPQQEFSLLSNLGTSGIVFDDGQGKVYKVMRDSGYYSYTEDEMAALTLLHQEGLAPKPHVLIDAAVDQQSEDSRRSQAGRPTKQNFSDVVIKRKAGSGKVPVIVMDKVNAQELPGSIAEDKIIEEFDRILPIAQKHGLVFGDVEPVVDKATGRITFIDLGGLGRYKDGMFDYSGLMLHAKPDQDTSKLDSRIKNLTPKQVQDIATMSTLADKLVYNWPLDSYVTKVYLEEGMEGIHNLMRASLQKGPATHDPAVLETIRQQDLKRNTLDYVFGSNTAG